MFQKFYFTYTGSIYQYKLFLISEASKRSLEYHWSDNKFPTAIPYYCLTHNPISKKFPLNCSENCGAVIPREEIY